MIVESFAAHSAESDRCPGDHNLSSALCDARMPGHIRVMRNSDRPKSLSAPALKLTCRHRNSGRKPVPLRRLQPSAVGRNIFSTVCPNLFPKCDRCIIPALSGIDNAEIHCGGGGRWQNPSSANSIYKPCTAPSPGTTLEAVVMRVGRYRLSKSSYRLTQPSSL